jgi:hypothetical protein
VHYLVFSVFASRRGFLLAANKASVFHSKSLCFITMQKKKKNAAVKFLHTFSCPTDRCASSLPVIFKRFLLFLMRQVVRPVVRNPS